MPNKVSNKLMNEYLDSNKTPIQAVNDYQAEQRQEFDEAIFQKRKKTLWNIVLFIMLLCFVVSVSIAFR